MNIREQVAWEAATSVAWDELTARQDGPAFWNNIRGNVVTEVRCGAKKRHLLAWIFQVPQGYLFVSRAKSTYPPNLRQAVIEGRAPDFLNDGETEFWSPTPDLLTYLEGVEHSFTEPEYQLNCRCGTSERPSRRLLLEAANESTPVIVAASIVRNR